MSPAKLDRCVENLKRKGKSESTAFGICNKSIKKRKKKGKK